MFNFYVFKYQDLDLSYDSLKGCVKREMEGCVEREMESWISLVHVCRRWRGLVFGSPRHLNLRLCATARMLLRAKRGMVTLDIWPALPLVVQGTVLLMDGVTPVFKHSDRINQINLEILTTWQIEKLWAVMEVPFPELAVLRLQLNPILGYPLRSIAYEVPFMPLRPSHPILGGPHRLVTYEVLPDSFLGGSALRLRYFYLDSIPFPGLPKLLLSATHLVELCLFNITQSGYISPKTMATGLSMLTSLETLRLEFKYSQPYPDLKGQLSSPPTRFILPALTAFWFKGVSEYLERLVARIDSPRLHKFSARFLEDIDFNTRELNQFISRTPTFGAYDEALLKFGCGGALVWLRQSHPGRSDHGMVTIEISSQVPDRLLSNLTQICTLSLRLLLTMENLYIGGNQDSPLIQENDIEITKWLDLLLPFTAVKNLYLSNPFSPCIALALHELTGGRTTEVLPVLQKVLLEWFQPSQLVEEALAQFISARQLTNHPVTISTWYGDFERGL